MSATDEEKQKEIEDKTAKDEIARLKDLETQNSSIKTALQSQLQRNQNYEAIFDKVSSLMGELLAVNARTTYVATMIKDLVDNRNAISSPPSSPQT